MLRAYERHLQARLAPTIMAGPTYVGDAPTGPRWSARLTLRAVGR